MRELRFLSHALLDLVDWAATHLDMLSNLKFQVCVLHPLGLSFLL
jgi:hypothetical protein